MIVKIHFDSYIMQGDSLTFEADTVDEIKEKFSQWLESKGMDPNINNPKLNAWSEVLDD